MPFTDRFVLAGIGGALLLAGAAGWMLLSPGTEPAGPSPAPSPAPACPPEREALHAIHGPIRAGRHRGSTAFGGSCRVDAAIPRNRTRRPVSRTLGRNRHGRSVQQRIRVAEWLRRIGDRRRGCR